MKVYWKRKEGWHTAIRFFRETTWGLWVFMRWKKTTLIKTIWTTFYCGLMGNFKVILFSGSLFSSFFSVLLKRTMKVWGNVYCVIVSTHKKGFLCNLRLKSFSKIAFTQKIMTEHLPIDTAQWLNKLILTLDCTEFSKQSTVLGKWSMLWGVREYVSV